MKAKFKGKTIFALLLLFELGWLLQSSNWVKWRECLIAKVYSLKINNYTSILRIAEGKEDCEGMYFKLDKKNLQKLKKELNLFSEAQSDLQKNKIISLIKQAKVLKIRPKKIEKRKENIFQNKLIQKNVADAQILKEKDIEFKDEVSIQVEKLDRILARLEIIQKTISLFKTALFIVFPLYVLLTCILFILLIGIMGGKIEKISKTLKNPQNQNTKRRG